MVDLTVGQRRAAANLRRALERVAHNELALVVMDGIAYVIPVASYAEMGNDIQQDVIEVHPSKLIADGGGW